MRPVRVLAFTAWTVNSRRSKFKSFHCPVFDVGSEDGTDFLVMEYLEGETLADRLTKGALPLDQALKYAIEIADALDKAHRQGVTHRDLKPANIMLTKAGAKLLDFGLAKLKPTGPQSDASTKLADALTEQGTILGTFQYMAPEQLEGQDADARTDIWAFGCVVYEMVTGKKAFQGKSQASLITAIMSSEPPPPSSVESMSPAGLDYVAKTCLGKDPDDRWQSAGDLADELRWISEAGSQAGVPAPVSARRKTRERIWMTASILLAATGGLLANLAGLSDGITATSLTAMTEWVYGFALLPASSLLLVALRLVWLLNRGPVQPLRKPP